MRLDRFLTLNNFRHLAKIFPQPQGIRIPILMYHSISDDPETGHPYYWINTSAERFAEQMRFLHQSDYKVITLSEAVRMIKPADNPQDGITSPFQESENCLTDAARIFPNLSPSTLPPDKFVVLTFDDGYEDFYWRAFPVLIKHSFRATVFLPTNYINTTVGGLRGKRHLTWHQVRELQCEGISFGSHTVTHANIGLIDNASLENEIIGSKEVIEQETVKKVVAFSYPYAFPEHRKDLVGRVIGLVKDAGYEFVVSTRIGTVHEERDIFALKRIPVNSGDDIRFFSAKIKGEYDWIYQVQHLSKRIRRKGKN